MPLITYGRVPIKGRNNVETCNLCINIKNIHVQCILYSKIAIYCFSFFELHGLHCLFIKLLLNTCMHGVYIFFNCRRYTCIYTGIYTCTRYVFLAICNTSHRKTMYKKAVFMHGKENEFKCFLQILHSRKL